MQHKFIVLILLFTLLSSCSKSSAEITSNNRLIKNIYGSIIIIDLRTNFPGEIGVIAPNKIFYAVHDDQVNCGGFSITGRQIEIDTEKLVGVHWVNGTPIVDHIFSLSGDYEIIISNNLETEYDNANGSVIIVHYMNEIHSKELQTCSF